MNTTQPRQERERRTKTSGLHAGESGQQTVKELFGVFGDRNDFERFRSPAAFDRVLEGPQVTLGVRNWELGIPGRTSVYEFERGTCALWGEVYPGSRDEAEPARNLVSDYTERGLSVLDRLNGSFLAVIDSAGRDAIVATDPVRSRECYFADVDGTRIFGSDPTAVARGVPDPTVAWEPLWEFIYFGIVFDDRTVLEDVQRVPFDSYLTETDTHQLDRFVYDYDDFDYVDELTTRLERALKRRSGLPGRKGVLLSGGYDSRAMLAGIPDVEASFTIGPPDSSEVSVAKRLANQYDVSHETLAIDERYFNTEPETVRYGHGIMESVHVHPAGYTERMDVDTIYHGYLGDTLLRGHFMPIEGVDVFDHKCPPYRLDPDPDVPSHFADKFGYQPAAERLGCHRPEVDGSGPEFLERRIDEVLDRWSHRSESRYDSLSLVGIQNQPARPFRYHLGDQFLESCVILDAELIDWHLSTPPRKRNTRTFLKALRGLDDDILRERPPDRPYNFYTLNQIDNFVRRKLPWTSGYEGSWPDRDRLYRQNALDRELFPDYPVARELPWRLKLRINDVTTWIETATGQRLVTPAYFLEPLQNGSNHSNRETNAISRSQTS